MTIPSILSHPALAPVLQALPAARLVGGCVRDTLAGRAVADVDLATPDPPDSVMRSLRAAGVKVAPTGLAHGTVTAISGRQPFEITTLRHDVETDGRHALVAWTDDWQQDAARRDFTINAMSMDRAGRIFDYFGGQQDLAAARVRFVGDPATRLAEDRLRALRFFRFHARYGADPPDPEAIQAIAATAPARTRLSAERVLAELRRILAVPDPLPILRLMRQTGVLAVILPEAVELTPLNQLTQAGAPPDPLLRFAALLAGADAADTAAARLRLSNAERNQLIVWHSGPPPPPDASDPALRRLLADTPAMVLTGRAGLAGYDQAARLAVLQPPPFPLEGRDVVAMGVPPGPDIGQWLRRIRAWWLQTGCMADKPQCLAQLAGMVSQADRTP